jgi:uncharacterized protein
MPSEEILKSLLAGVVAGFASGFLGVSPGGILVPVVSMLLPFAQHVVQGISLIVQAPPTSISSLSAYTKKGRRLALAPIILVSAGFLTGGPIGALLAQICSERELRWMFVGYLLILVTLSALKGAHTTNSSLDSTSQDQASYPILASAGIGVIAGISSGLLGIGGGLAITALCVVLLHRNQHEAQALSLAITAMPLTLPAAWVYAHQESHLPWQMIGCIVAGLAAGGWAGGTLANLLTGRDLKLAFTSLLLAMALYMAVTAMRA